MADRSFHFRHPVEVRFKDVDVGGHAHHSHALVYFEEARAAWWREINEGERRGHGLGGVDYILAEASVRYHHRVLWPQRLDVGVRVARLTRRSFELEYEVRSEEGDEVLVSGSTTQVMYDYDAGRSKPVPPEVRTVLEELDGPFDRRGYPRNPT